MYLIYAAVVTEGLESVATEHIGERLGNATGFRILAEKPGRIFFAYGGEPRQLLQLRAVEHVLLIVRRWRDMTRSRHALSNLQAGLGRIDFRTHFDICRKVGLKVRRRITFHVTAHMEGRRNYRRIDVQQAVEQALLGYGWRLAEDDAALDVWVEVLGDDAHVGIRLSPFTLAQRDYKQAHIPGSLPPTVAYSLVQLSNPQPGDLFLDPMCGAGTILIERALSGRYRYLLGGDIAQDAVEAARTNIGRKHRPRQLFRWDARALPLSQWSVDKIVCNPPFGAQIATHRNIRPLYEKFLRESHRVLKPTGRLVLITTQRTMLDELLNDALLFKVAQRLPLDLRGQRACVYLCFPR